MAASAQTFTVCYNYAVNGGTPASVRYAYLTQGAPVDLTQNNAQKTGYEFVGWSLTADSHSVLPDFTMGEQDVTLYAIYRKAVVCDYIGFDGTVKATVSVTAYKYNNESTVSYRSPLYTAYPGWTPVGYTAASGISATVVASASDSASGQNVANTTNDPLTLYTIYRRTLTLRFEANGGDASPLPGDQTGTQYVSSANAAAALNPSIVIPSVIPVRAGYSFVGWRATSGAGPVYAAGSSIEITADTTLEAQWLWGEVSSHTVAFNYAENGGQSASMNSLSANQGEDIYQLGAMPTANRQYWSFVGWNDDKAAKAGLSAYVVGGTDSVLYAIFSRTMVITYVDYAGTVKTTHTESGTAWNKETVAKITTPALGDRGDGWIPVGWSFPSQASLDEAVVSEKPGKTQNVSVTGSNSSGGTFYGVYKKQVTLSYDMGNSGAAAPAASSPYRYFNSSGSYANPRVMLANVPVRPDGLSFLGWAKGSPGAAPLYAAGDYVDLDADTVMFPVWDVPALGVSLNKHVLALTRGMPQKEYPEETLIATVTPANASNKAVTWSSSNPGIVTVDASGKVTAVAPGTAVVAVTTVVGGKTDSCTVTVTYLDTDGDGLWDIWEMDGADTDGDGTVDLHVEQMGADPAIPDVFIECDWMEDTAHNLQPHVNTLKNVYQAFLDHGIQVHFDAGPESVDFVTGTKWKNYPGGSGGNSFAYATNFGSPQYTGSGVPAGNWLALVNANFSAGARRRIFHHVGFISGMQSGVAGVGSLPGQFMLIVHQNDGWSVDSGSLVNHPAGWTDGACLMHELGHNLGLMHGGMDNYAYKPNYLSGMNYRYNYSGNFAYNYSEYKLPDLDEKSLNEGDGLDPGGLTAGKNFTASWDRFDYQDGNTLYFTRLYIKPVNGTPIDFNKNGQIDSTPVQAPVSIDSDLNANKVYRSQTDWDKLKFKSGTIGTVGPAQMQYTLEEFEEMPLPEEVSTDELKELKLFPEESPENLGSQTVTRKMQDEGRQNPGPNKDSKLSKFGLLEWILFFFFFGWLWM
ncbi:MAG: InlB B-repeat-containing protein [Oscillospiraceae bacterium]|nr:InlB B-repeat-containing protein [Oscillospiraceae bacterium]